MDVTPEHQNIEKLFGSQVYEIDFYQRQYKWGKEPVQELLRDVFYKFNEEYRKYGQSDVEIDVKIADYAWYYLNTYVTTTVSGRTYVVDGQQRLTTLTLILIKLFHLASIIDVGLSDWIANKVRGRHGRKNHFWMNHEGSIERLNAVFDKGVEAEVLESTITAQNLVANYKTISDWIDRELPMEDKRRFEAFVYYFMNRLVLVALDVSDNLDVPMVFEVINDRGVKLRPYEILKGKLLGQIEKEELKALKLNEIWDSHVGKLNEWRDDEADAFFRTYLRSKFVNSASERQMFDGEYHRPMMAVAALGLERNPSNVKRFLRDDFVYYSRLYVKVLTAREDEDPLFPAVYYNALTRMDVQVALILSACAVNDSEEDIKIKVVSEELDRMFCLLQLQGCYDSNEFSRRLIDVMSQIRGRGVEEIPNVFDQTLRSMIAEKKDVPNLSSLWSYGYFKNIGYEMNRPFIRYVLARLEQFVSAGAKVSVRHSIRDLVTKKYSNGFHVEHILAKNAENLEKFPDEEAFLSQRNRLGDLLLLKGADNESSGKEPYADKLKTYVGSLLWNETLVEATYAHNLDLRRWIQDGGYNLHAMSTFGPDEIEERHQLLFELFAQIWHANRNLAV